MTKPARRREDRWVIIRMWEEIRPVWHIITGVMIFFVAVVTWGNNVSGYAPMIEKNTTDIKEIQMKYSDVEARMRVLESNVTDIKKDTGAIYGILMKKGDKQ